MSLPCKRLFLAGWLASFLAGWLAGWLPGWLAAWLASWLAGWQAGWLAGRLACWLAWLARLAGWLAGKEYLYAEPRKGARFSLMKTQPNSDRPLRKRDQILIDPNPEIRADK